MYTQYKILYNMTLLCNAVNWRKIINFLILIDQVIYDIAECNNQLYNDTYFSRHVRGTIFLRLYTSSIA